MKKYTLGLVSISFRNHTPEEIISAAKAAGLGCIEWGSDVHAPFDKPRQLSNIACLQDEYKIQCSSYGTYFCLGRNDISELEGYINAAGILDTDILRLWCGTKSSLKYSRHEKERLYAQCYDAANIAAKHGVTICMECHNNTLTDTKDAALELMQTIDSPHFRMYWQPNQYKSLEENLSYARSIAPYCKHIHVFNWEGNVKLPLSEGSKVWKQYLNEFTGEKTLLLEFMPDNMIESLQEEARSLYQIAKADNNILNLP